MGTVVVAPMASIPGQPSVLYPCPCVPSALHAVGQGLTSEIRARPNGVEMRSLLALGGKKVKASTERHRVARGHPHPSRYV